MAWKVDPRFCECEEKNCVLLPAAGRKTQLIHLIFTEPGVRLLGHPCKSFTRNGKRGILCQGCLSWAFSSRGLASHYPLHTGRHSAHVWLWLPQHQDTGLPQPATASWDGRGYLFQCMQTYETVLFWILYKEAWKDGPLLVLNQMKKLHFACLLQAGKCITLISYNLLPTF